VLTILRRKLIRDGSSRFSITEHQLKSFLQACREDAGLRERISQAKTAEEAVSIAKAAGFSIEPSELLNVSRGLSDKELENVAGGGGEPDGPTYMCDMTKNPCVIGKPGTETIFH
jgi:predicted ribosomally synthesized peptide with nif11-like leader